MLVANAMATVNERVASQHVFHEGFPLMKDDRISLFHRLTRTRFGIILFVLYIICFVVYPVSFVVVVTFPILRLRLTKHIYIRRFYDWAVGRYLLLMAVRTFNKNNYIVNALSISLQSFNF